MAAFRKMKSFLSGLQQKQGTDSDDKEEETHDMLPPDLPHGRDDLRKTEEIIEEIDPAYFNEPELDCSELELKQFTEEISITKLEDQILSLKTQDNAVYRKIYDLVFANYTAYVQELENVTMLEVSLQQATSTCVNARRQLTESRKGVSHGGLGLLAKHRRRERLRVLLDILRTLKTLQRTDARLKELLREGEYPSATQICLECQDVIQIYKHYSCVSEMSVSLQDVQSDIEHELENALGKVCTRFRSDAYIQVQEAYQKLGKTQTAVDTLLMKFTTTIHDSAYAVVLKYIQVGNSPAEDLSPKVNYSNLCKLISGDQFILCLEELCLASWRVLYNYYQVYQWHINERDDNGTGGSAFQDLFDQNYVRTKLKNGLLRVWRDVQQKVRPYLLANDLSQFKYDDFLRVLEIVNRLINVGIEFCGEGSDSLEESMRQQSLKYFRNYHRGRLEDLKLFLENEQWEPCPVRPSFSIQKLREFKFVRDEEPSSSVSSKTNPGHSPFCHYSLDDDPFSYERQDEEREDVIDTGEEAMSDDDRVDDYQETDGNDGRQPKGFNRSNSRDRKGPLLSNTTLTVLRFFGNYIQMMKALRTIASDVLECLTQIFDYYLYAVYKFFAVDLLQEYKDDIHLSTKLITTLTRIEETLLPQVPTLYSSPFVGVDDQNQLFGLECRVVAVESLVFLASQFLELIPYLKVYVQGSKQSFLEQFVSHTVKTVQELRRPVYQGIASKAIPFHEVFQMMCVVKWELREIMSQHSSYVDRLLQKISEFQQKVESINKKIMLPLDATSMLWERVILLSNRLFVEGFSQAKKCSNEGRALMQVDFQQFRTQIEKMSNIRPLPQHFFVEDYIKAYYLSEADTESWIRTHKEYSAKHLQALIVVGVGSRSGKKCRQRLLAIVEELDS